MRKIVIICDDCDIEVEKMGEARRILAMGVSLQEPVYGMENNVPVFIDKVLCKSCYMEFKGSENY